MLVKDIMTTAPITVTVDAPLAEVLDLLIDRLVSGLPVVDATGAVRGVVSEGDLLRRMELGTAAMPRHWWERLFTMEGAAAYRLANGRKAADVMSAPAITVGEDVPLDEAASLMEKHGIKRLPVVRAGRLVGMLSRADFVRALRCVVAPARDKPEISDEGIKHRIEAELQAQAWAGGCAIDVAVADRRVTLKGTVGTDDQRRAVVVVAENTPGVRSTDARITVIEPVPAAGA